MPEPNIVEADGKVLDLAHMREVAVNTHLIHDVAILQSMLREALDLAIDMAPKVAENIALRAENEVLRGALGPAENVLHLLRLDPQKRFTDPYIVSAHKNARKALGLK